MRKSVVSSCMWLLLTFAASHASASWIDGRIVNVNDGDTLVLLDSHYRQHKIRMRGIDAPESGMAFGARAKQHLVSLVKGKDATAECISTDRYGRQVCTVIVSGENINHRMVRDGYAWWYRQYSSGYSPEAQRRFADDEALARQQKLGLWADNDMPTPPWEWRRNKQDRVSAN